MRKLSILFLFLSFHGSLYAQTIFIGYKRSPNIEYQLRNEFRPEVRKRVANYLEKTVKQYVLITTDTTSIYALAAQQHTPATSLNLMNVEGCYKNLAENRLVMDVSIRDEAYFIEDKLTLFQLKPIKGKKKILGHTCKAFEAIYQGKEKFTFWVTKEVDLKNGPAEFHTNEGLILQVQAKSYSLTAQSIRFSENTEKITIPEAPKKAALMTYSAYKDQIEQIKQSVKSNTKTIDHD